MSACGWVVMTGAATEAPLLLDELLLELLLLDELLDELDELELEELDELEELLLTSVRAITALLLVTWPPAFETTTQ